MQTSEDELNATTFQIYRYLIKADKPTGPREIMRGTDITSSGVVYRHLQKLSDLSLVEKDDYGRYIAKQKVGFKGYVWFGKNLFPRFMLYSFFFIGLLIVLIAVLVLRIFASEPIDISFFLLIAVTGISALMFIVEGILLNKRMPK